MTPYKAKSIANAFITMANRDGYDITPMQLQKLMYYANGYFLAENDGQPLINEYFEAWDYGPVVPTVFYEFREYKDKPIKRFAYTYDRDQRKTIVAPQPIGDQRSEAVLDWVWKSYRDYDGVELSRMTHKVDGPWDRARRRAANSFMRNERLEMQDLRDYFEALV